MPQVKPENLLLYGVSDATQNEQALKTMRSNHMFSSFCKR